MPELVVVAEQLLAPVPGGTGRYTRELVTAMAAAAPEGWHLATATARHRDTSRARVPGVPARSLPLPRRALTLAWERGLSLWPGGDVVHAPTPLAPPHRDRPVVVTIHDTVPFTHPETLTPRGVTWHRAMIHRATERAAAVIVPTAAVADDLARFAPGPAPVHVIHHGVTRLTPPPDADAVATRLGLPERYVLAIGTLEPRKGIDTLLAAAPRTPLVLVGQAGWGSVDTRGALTLGGLDDADLAVVLRRAGALVVPSRAEGFGLPLLEGMAAGVPVIHSDAPALVEVAGGTGTAFRRGDPDDLAAALRAVLAGDHPPVDAARRRAAGFTWSTAARDTWGVITGPL